jgi:hypothetical protein
MNGPILIFVRMPVDVLHSTTPLSETTYLDNSNQIGTRYEAVSLIGETESKTSKKSNVITTYLSVMKIKFTCFGSITDLGIVSILFILSFFSFLPHSFSQFQANISSNCENGNCTTTICVDDKPCKTTNSNTTNMTSINNLLPNNTDPIPKLPSEIA